MMRSLKAILICVLSCGLVPLVGCPGDDTGDDGNYVCGDGVCEASDGENKFNCSEDCASPMCGDGTCNGMENSQNCSSDCPAAPVCGDGICNGSETSSSCPGDCPASACQDPHFPVDCHDGTGCWSPGTHCNAFVFTCNGQLRRCVSNADWASCCSNAFQECPPAFPYYCPADNICYSSPPFGCPASCTYVAQDCGP